MIDASLVNWPTVAYVYLWIITFTPTFLLILNYYGYTLFTRIYFFIDLFISLTILSTVVGRDSHYQYLLLAIVGMPYILFESKYRLIRRIFMILPLVLFLILDLVVFKFEPFTIYDEASMYYIRISSDLGVFGIIIVQVLIFTKYSDYYIDELHERQSNLAKKNEELEEFAHIISHDLKAPLNNISGFVKVMGRDQSLKENARVQSIIPMLEKSINQSRELIDNILSFAKAGKYDENEPNIALNDAISYCTEYLKEGQKKRLKIEIQDDFLLISKTGLEQVLVNLIGNAFKYHDKEDGIVEVVSKKISDTKVRIEVKDNGPGIPLEHHDRLFDIFHTAHGQKRKDSTGIGLAIVKKLVQKVGGDVGIISDGKTGATLWFTWPIVVS